LFGEIALMYAKPRSSTVTSKTAGVLWKIDRSVFMAVLKMGTQDKSRAMETLKSVDILRSLSATQLKSMAENLQEETWNSGDYIVRQGDNTQSLYLIMEGHVKCTAMDESTGDEKVLLELQAGQYVGERSLLNKVPRAANVIATRFTKTLNISKQTFEEQLGDLNTIIQKDSKEREYKANARLERQRKAGVAGAEFGSFSAVCLVQEDAVGQYVLMKHTPTGKEFTFKVWAKQQALGNKATRLVMQEHRIVTSLVDENDFAPPMILALETAAYLIEAFDTVAVFALHDCMADYGPFDEGTALFYAATIFLAIEHLHSRGVAYRNISSETIMINSLGYPMLMDCRFAAEVDESEKFTDLCGSYAFLAPEQVSGSGHKQEVDYWALGVLIFEMITEKTPWATGNPASDTEEAYYSKIASHYPGSIHYPDAFSLELVAILDLLLEPNVKKRISTPKDFQNHAWLQVVNWEQLRAMAVIAPHAPEVTNALAEKKAKGTSKCLNAVAYRGSTAWFDGFAPQAAAATVSPQSSAQSSAQGQAGNGRISSVVQSIDVPVGPAVDVPEDSERSAKKKKGLFGAKKKDVTL